jgi:hypothetical protein
VLIAFTVIPAVLVGPTAFFLRRRTA